MTSSAQRARRGPKPMLSRAAVIEAALDLIDADGLAALNLRKLATRLGVSAMTPYSYFADKADLLTAMLGHALEPLAADLDPSQPWDVQVDGAMRDLHAVLEQHPGAVELILAESDAPRLEEFRQRLIGVLSETGLSPVRGADALRTLTSYILGYTLLQRLRPAGRSHGRPTDSFDSGLAMIMDSLRREVTPPG